MEVKEIQQKIQDKATKAVKGGAYIEINEASSMILVRNNKGQSFLFQGENAEHMLARVPSMFENMKESYFLAHPNLVEKGLF